MFVGFSQKVRGGLRLGVGMRITKKNFLYMAFIVLMYYIAYISIVGSIWLIVAICYGIFVLPVKWIIRAVKGGNDKPASNIAAPAPTTQIKPQISVRGSSRTPLTEAPFAKNIDGEYELKYTYDDVNIAMVKNLDKVENRMNITFKPEPDNEYDANAVAVHVGSKTKGFTHIGYLFKGKLQDMYHDFIGRGGYVVGAVQIVDGDNIRLFVGFYEKI